MIWMINTKNTRLGIRRRLWPLILPKTGKRIGWPHLAPLSLSIELRSDMRQSSRTPTLEGHGSTNLVMLHYPITSIEFGFQCCSDSCCPSDWDISSSQYLLWSLWVAAVSKHWPSAHPRRTCTAWEEQGLGRSSLSLLYRCSDRRGHNDRT